jgi:predicted PP-loop superfamily ATPase
MEKQYLEQLVKESDSFSEILRKQNKAVSGTAVKILKDKLDLYQIPYHFINDKDVPKTKTSLNEILVENSKFQSSKLKNRLIEEGIKNDVCEICGQSNS